MGPGEPVARRGHLVDGVTKLGKVRFNAATEQQVENYRRMPLSMAEDAGQTRDIYAPLAHRLGMAAIR